MADAITIKALQDASLDAKSLEEVVNGNESKQVTTRKGETYPSVKKAIKTLFENGGLPATPFATKALMTASALVNGKYAMVTDDNNNNGLYVKTAGAWVKSANDPVEQAVAKSSDVFERLVAESNKDNVFEFRDSQGMIGLAIDSDANINANNIYQKEIGDLAFVVEDKNGKIALAIDNDGYLASPTLDNIKNDIRYLKGLLSDKPEIEDTLIIDKVLPYKSDYMQFFSYGQSLSRGSRATPVLSTSQPYSNLVFKSGVMPRQKDSNHDFSSLYPLREWIYETPTSSTLNRFVEIRVAKGDNHTKWVFIGTAPGEGGTVIDQLNKGTVYYNGLIAQVQAAYDIAQAEGKTHSVWAVSWTQGETNYNTQLTQEQYSQKLVQFRDDLLNDVKIINGQTYDFPIVHYQVNAHRVYGRDDMDYALSHKQVAEENEGFILACPIYHLPHADDNLHLTNDSSVQLGKYYAKALEYSVFSGEKWQPLKPVKFERQGEVLSIHFNKPNLVLDTELVAETHNMGFDFWQDEAVIDIINSVELVDTNRVNIKTSQPIPSGSVLSYGRGRPDDPRESNPTAGSRGNLRDSEGDVDNYIDSKGVTRFMHNWCVLFEETFI